MICLLMLWDMLRSAGIYVAYNGTETSPSTSLSSAQKEYSTKFIFLSKSYPGGVELTKALPAGPYFLEPASGDIYEGEQTS